MAQEDLSRLKIQKTAETPHRAGRRIPPVLIAAVVGLFILLLLYFQGTLTPALEVEAVTVSKMYPSQAFTLLNASGYVMAQRKAAVAPKVTGTMVWRGVQEGSVVNKGQLIARLENEDVTAARNQAAADLNVARSNLEQARAELNDATVVAEERAGTCFQKGMWPRLTMIPLKRDSRRQRLRWKAPKLPLRLLSLRSTARTLLLNTR